MLDSVSFPSNLVVNVVVDISPVLNFDLGFWRILAARVELNSDGGVGVGVRTISNSVLGVTMGANAGEGTGADVGGGLGDGVDGADVDAWKPWLADLATVKALLRVIWMDVINRAAVNVSVESDVNVNVFISVGDADASVNTSVNMT